MRQPADIAATKRSILRYLRRYEHDWYDDTVPVHVYLWEMEGCTPPEEDPEMGVILTRGRVRYAVTCLVRDGLLHRDSHCGRVWISLTNRGRTEVPYEACP